MTAHCIVLVFVLLGLNLRAEPPQFQVGKLTTKSGKTYSLLTVSSELPDGIKVTHSDGILKQPISEIPDELVTRLGGFDAGLAEKETQRLADEKAETGRLALEAQAREAQDQAAWEPFPSYIAKLEQNVVTDADAVNLKQARLALENLKAVCRPLFDSGSVNRSTVNAWVQCVIEKTVVVGMPEELVILAWGSPSDTNRNSYGDDQWVYRTGRFKSAYVYINKKGRVAAWQD